MNNFHYAISLAQTLYDVEGDTYDLEEIGLIAYNFIGNKYRKTFWWQQLYYCLNFRIFEILNVYLIRGKFVIFLFLRFLNKHKFGAK